MRQVNEGFAVELNPVIKNLLLASIGLCQFAITHKNNPFAELAKKNDLADENELLFLAQRIRDTNENDEILFTLQDEILIYTVLDITCKLFLTNLSEELQEYVTDLQTSGSNFYEVRSTLLRGAEFVRENLRKTFSTNDQFMHRVELLDMILTIE
ncbi:MAG: hypothetical protein LC117_03195 [Bacteroidia bacterium]|nr:hypothetical protein [Bacteroidia bacterium]MCZ2276917.1 hypothetical protein [Bacteroidia bacterium]